MVKRLTLTSVAATLLLLGATPIAPAKAGDFGSDVSGAFTSAFKGLKEGVLGAYEDGTEGAKDLYGDAKAELTGQPKDPYKTTASFPTAAVRDDLVYRVQTELNASGYAAGQPDGVYGPQTANAVRAYQANNGMVADGIVTMSLYDHMRTNPNRPAGATPPAGQTTYYTAPAPAPVTPPVTIVAPPAPAAAPPVAGTVAPGTPNVTAPAPSVSVAPALPALPQTTN